MRKPFPTEKPPIDWRAIFGVVATVLWMSIIFGYYRRNREAFDALQPNDLADVCAGVFGPVGFLWLILGYLQQGAELRLNTEALRLQVIELKESVVAQRKAADAAEIQAKETVRQFEHARRVLERSIQPNLTIDAVFERSSENCDIWTVKVRNTGASCFSIYFFIEARWFDLLGSSIESIDFLGPNDTTTTEYQLKKGHVFRSVRICYIDSRGDARAQRFRITTGFADRSKMNFHYRGMIDIAPRYKARYEGSALPSATDDRWLEDLTEDERAAVS